jgi:hypothetical protein
MNHYVGLMIYFSKMQLLIAGIKRVFPVKQVGLLLFYRKCGPNSYEKIAP